MNEAKKKLSEISSQLFSNDASFGEIFQIVKDYKALLEKATSINFEDSQTGENIFTESGKAIGPKWAGMCVDDVFRTQKFCRGLLKAVKAKQSTNPSKKVHIVYAGTGPFATLVLPLTTIFTSEEITFSFLEINELSINGLKETISFFEIASYIDKIEQCDATTYTFINEDHIDIVIIEAMMFSLKDEHQVSISYNLISQLSKEVILIPEKITLNLLAVNAERRNANKLTLKESIPYSEKLGRLFQLSKDEIFKNANAFMEAFPNYEFPQTRIEIPRTLYRNFDELHVETEIKIFENEVLQIDESGLTVLDKFHEFKSMMTPSQYLVATYMCGQKPGLYFRFEN
jgi:hypothetical protein